MATGAENMLKYTGKTACGGIQIGPAMVQKPCRAYEKKREREEERNAQEEIGRVRDAAERVIGQLRELREKAQKKLGKEAASIFEAHSMILEDKSYLEEVSALIRSEHMHAEDAVIEAGRRLAGLFADTGSEYMRQRAADVREITARLRRELSGTDAKAKTWTRPHILVTEEIAADEMLLLDQEKVLAVVAVNGSVHSHAAILARMRNIPMLVDVSIDIEQISTGTKTIVNGSRGEVIFAPTQEQEREAVQCLEQERERERKLRREDGYEKDSCSGRRMKVYANIGGLDDLQRALENGAEGVGLFRSEFLYLGREELPTEEEQYQIYRRALEMMDGKRLVVRTIDLGADKQLRLPGIQDERNPALGCRGIRLCLEHPELFRPQLRALLRCAVHGNLSVMYPMITSTEEVRKIGRITEELCAELEEEELPYKMPEQGIMIETPAAVMISEELAEMVDFFSIGTNDLTQYALAVDRQNEKLAEYYQPRHDAILRMIEMTVENAHRHGKKVCICGELGADTGLTKTFLDMGVDELSVAPGMILRVKQSV